MSRVRDIKEHPGFGMEAVIDGKRAFVGSSRFMEQMGADYRQASGVGTAVHVVYGMQSVSYTHLTLPTIGG